MSKTAEYALEQMCRSLGRQEQSEQLRRMRQACDDKTMRDIVADNRNSVFPITGNSRPCRRRASDRRRRWSRTSWLWLD
jgi:hypothetical protein